MSDNWRNAVSPRQGPDRVPAERPKLSPRPPADAAPEERPAGGSGPRPPTKTSIGIILCRVNRANNRPEVLLVHKRYTYAFAEFVHGRYVRGRAGLGSNLRSVAALLDNMTVEELLDVHSLDFAQMWYRIWLSHNKRDLYNKKYAKFHTSFMRDDDGKSLRRLIQQTRRRGTLLWEVPKGRRLNPREADIMCAVRELREETGIDKSEYRFLPGIKRRVSYVSAGTRYVCAYYVAIANPHLADGNLDRAAIRDISCMGEVSEIQWHDIERVRLLDGPEARLESLVAPAFKLVKQYKKGRWASRRHASPLALLAARPPAAQPPAPPQVPRAQARPPRRQRPRARNRHPPAEKR